MTFEEAKELLAGTVRSELRDHAFGDAEVYWYKDDVEVAGGYFGNSAPQVHIINGPTFVGEQARELRKCGTEGRIDRNDETGPETFNEGTIMPGLTLEGVKEEITKER